MALGYRRKQAKQAAGSKPISSVPPLSLIWLHPPGFCLEFLPRFPLIKDCALETKISSFPLPSYFWSQWLYHSNTRKLPVSLFLLVFHTCPCLLRFLFEYAKPALWPPPLLQPDSEPISSLAILHAHELLFPLILRFCTPRSTQS